MGFSPVHLGEGFLVTDTPLMGFVELTDNHGHQEVVSRYLRIAIAADVEVVLFTTPTGLTKVEDNMDIDRIETMVGNRSREFFDEISKVCNDQVDVLFFNTIQGKIADFVRYVRFNPGCPMIFWPHRASTWFEHEFVIKPTAGLSTNLSLNIKNVLRPYIRSRMDGVLVPFKQTEEYLRERYSPSQSIHTLPPVIYEGPNTTIRSEEQEDIVQITLPGGITDRRDYDIVLDVFEEHLLPHSGDDVRLTLLGRPVGEYGRQIIDRVDELRASGADIESFSEWIPSETFRETYAQSSLIINPIKRDATGRPEKWGLTWHTGTLFDVLMYPTPVMVPESYSVPSELQSSALTYDTADEMKRNLEKVLSEPEFLSGLQKAAVANASDFTEGHQVDRFQEIITRHL